MAASLYTEIANHLRNGTWIITKPKKETNGLASYTHMRDSTGAPTRHRPKYQAVKKGEAKCRAPYGISDPYKGQGDWERRNLDLSLENHEELLAILSAIDEYVLNSLVDNSEAWFGAKHDRAMISTAFFRPLVKVDEKGQYAPTFRLKVNMKEDPEKHKYNTRFFLAEQVGDKIVQSQIPITFRDENKELKPSVSIVDKGTELIPIIEVGAIRKTAGKVGLTLEASDIVVFKEVQSSDAGFSWGDDTKVVSSMDVEEEDDPEAIVVTGTEADVDATATANTTTAAADDYVPPADMEVEDDEGEEEEEA
eukprot:TRINITY_DN72919_c0_g1_i1.p1 TRINITY_DN72919_c0_g1~~TRINITY_DN72919_c0_g1_i1.p1  ORF type:complete len:340 (+),score=76.05 TRINITY_DN72919_c0_g1_i1:99-1022(+)